MKVVWNTCDNEPGREMESVNGNDFESSLETFQKLFPFAEIYVKYF